MDEIGKFTFKFGLFRLAGVVILDSWCGSIFRLLGCSPGFFVREAAGKFSPRNSLTIAPTLSFYYRYLYSYNIYLYNLPITTPFFSLFLFSYDRKSVGDPRLPQNFQILPCSFCSTESILLSLQLANRPNSANSSRSKWIKVASQLFPSLSSICW